MDEQRMALDAAQTWVQTPPQALPTRVAMSSFGFRIFKMDLILRVSDDRHSFKSRHGCHNMNGS